MLRSLPGQDRNKEELQQEIYRDCPLQVDMTIDTVLLHNKRSDDEYMNKQLN